MKRSGETVEGVMAFSNENATLEDNTTTLEGDTATLEDNTTYDEGNEDLFPADEYRFDDNSDDGLDEWHDESSDDDWLYDSDIPICDNVEGETKPVEGVDERGNAGISRTWVILGAKRFSFQTITTEESTCADYLLYKRRMFSLKAELKRALNMLALKEQFGIRVKRSYKGRYEVGCKDKACKFDVRATKLLEGEYWQVRMFHKVHTCTVDGLQGRFSTWGLECLYGKAWQAKEYAKKLVFGPPEESFQLLPSYFYMLEQENPDTITTVATDVVERFKYCFWSYETCIRGFRDVMRLMVTIDVTHLKSKFKGVLFIAVCKDANKCVYPIVFGIGHVEDKDSWTWFLSKLRDAVGCPENIRFISNQHLSIKKTIQNAYPETHHGLCGYHLKKNFKNKFKHDDVSMIFNLA
ncbi:PREDICTED: uncharacterized protein LOC108661153 [Theobroma cacao]|uniref:Uncharacterized protein LOC108661153 n=1 Tax=Theobroma cacao TaxID=3641 RepID=A0AB32W3K8_THECC|nr:PREDICTED: uncharacterized protein LOC108661153 [Theobroma cacao]